MSQPIGSLTNRTLSGRNHGLERYRQFKLGRQDAVLACRQDLLMEIEASAALPV